MMKLTALLINTARGDLIDEAALREALRAGTIAAAGLGVSAKEPPVDSPLLSLDNVDLTPHCAEFAPTSTLATMGRAVDNVLHLFCGRRLAFPEVLPNLAVLAWPRRLRVFFLRAYNPELNPGEYLNQDVKSNAPGRQRPWHQAEMLGTVQASLRSRQRHPAYVRRYFQAEPIQNAAMPRLSSITCSRE